MTSIFQCIRRKCRRDNIKVANCKIEPYAEYIVPQYDNALSQPDDKNLAIANDVRLITQDIQHCTILVEPLQS